jgi:hypothetical protein
MEVKIFTDLHLALTATRYSASAKESAITCCFLYAQVTGPESRLKT